MDDRPIEFAYSHREATMQYPAVLFAALTGTLLLPGCRSSTEPEESAPPAVAYLATGSVIELRTASGEYWGQIDVSPHWEISSLSCARNAAAVAYYHLPRSGGSGLFVVIPGGAAPRELTAPTVNLYGPAAWSADGSQLAVAFSSRFTGDPHAPPEAGIAVMRAGGSDFQILLTIPAYPRDLSWSPDGREIAFTRLASSAPFVDEVWSLNVATRTTRLVVSGASRPRWSPDGNRLAVATPALMVLDASGQNPSIIPAMPLASSYSWTADGRILYAMGVGLWIADLSGAVTPFITEGIQRFPHWCGTP